MPDASQYPDSIGKINPEQIADKIASSERTRTPRGKIPPPEIKNQFRSVGEILKGMGLL